jgi:hypothetical protein
MRWLQRTSGHSYLRVSWWFKLVYTLQGKNLTNTSYVWPHRSHIWHPSVKSLLSQNRVSAPGMKSWLTAIIRPGHHPGLPHSPSNKSPWSREGWFDIVVTELLGLPGPINPTCVQFKSKLAIGAKTMQFLIDIGRGYHHGTSKLPWPSPHPSLLSDPLSSICPAWSCQQTRT